MQIIGSCSRTTHNMNVVTLIGARQPIIPDRRRPPLTPRNGQRRNCSIAVGNRDSMHGRTSCVLLQRSAVQCNAGICHCATGPRRLVPATADMAVAQCPRYAVIVISFLGLSDSVLQDCGGLCGSMRSANPARNLIRVSF